MVNKVTLIGRLGSDPEIRTLESGVAVGRFSVATSENYKDRNGEWQEQTEWHDVVVWRAAAERAQRVLSKGVMIYVEGKLTHRKWQDKEGNNRKTTEVVSNYYRVLQNPNATGESRDYDTSTVAAPSTPTPATATTTPPVAATTPAEPTGPASGDFGTDDDGADLPF